jgi:hypothetical protein
MKQLRRRWQHGTHVAAGQIPGTIAEGRGHKSF